MAPIGQRSQPVLKRHRHARGIADQIALFDDGYVFQRQSRGNRMPRCGIAMAERANPVGIVGNRAIHLFRKQHGGQRHIRRRQLFAQRHDIGGEAILFTAERRAQPPKAADHLIRHHKDIVFAAQRLDPLPIAIGRRHHTARPHQRLADEGSNGFRAFAQNHLFGLGNQAGAERCLILARRAKPIEMRAGQVMHRNRWQIEIAVVARQPGQRPRRNGDPVISLDPAEEFLFLRAAHGVVHVPDQFHNRIVRL